MRFSSAAIAAASVFSVAEAKINGISVPATIKPGDGFNMVIESSDFIQSVYDVAIAVGYAPGKGFPGDLGTPIGSYNLGPGMFPPPPPAVTCFTRAQRPTCNTQNNPTSCTTSTNGSRCQARPRRRRSLFLFACCACSGLLLFLLCVSFS